MLRQVALRSRLRAKAGRSFSVWFLAGVAIATEDREACPEERGRLLFLALRLGLGHGDRCLLLIPGPSERLSAKVCSLLNVATLTLPLPTMPSSESEAAAASSGCSACWCCCCKSDDASSSSASSSTPTLASGWLIISLSRIAWSRNSSASSASESSSTVAFAKVSLSPDWYL